MDEDQNGFLIRNKADLTALFSALFRFKIQAERRGAGLHGCITYSRTGECDLDRAMG
jgi:hypothetical protein